VAAVVTEAVAELVADMLVALEMQVDMLVALEVVADMQEQVDTAALDALVVDMRLQPVNVQELVDTADQLLERLQQVGTAALDALAVDMQEPVDTAAEEYMAVEREELMVAEDAEFHPVAITVVTMVISVIHALVIGVIVNSTAAMDLTAGITQPGASGTLQSLVPGITHGITAGSLLIDLLGIIHRLVSRYLMLTGDLPTFWWIAKKKKGTYGLLSMKERWMAC